MAISIETKTEKYPDLPLTNFPVSEDAKKRMVDVNSVLMPVVIKYNEYFAAGNLSACNNLIKNNPDVLDCFFNADKWNWTRDALIALERFYLEDIEPFINAVAQNAVGINDNPTAEQASLVAYSAEKIISLFNEIRAIKKIVLAASGWNASAPYTQKVNLSSITMNDTPYISIDSTQTRADRKLQEKAWNKFVDRATSNDGYILFQCDEVKPSIDIHLLVKGV